MILALTGISVWLMKYIKVNKNGDDVDEALFDVDDDDLDDLDFDDDDDDEPDI